MEIPVNSHGSTKVVSIPSVVDDETVHLVDELLRRLIAEDARNIVCNFSQTESVSEAGLAMFISVLKDLHRLQGQMVFCLLKPGLRELFSAAGLTNLYHYYERDEALQTEILRELSAHFDEYADFHGVRLHRDDNRLYIEIFLEFDPEKKMRQVQYSINNIKRKLEAKIKNSEVLIVPTTQEGAGAT
jgi:anti-anti-sigma factor